MYRLIRSIGILLAVPVFLAGQTEIDSTRTGPGSTRTSDTTKIDSTRTETGFNRINTETYRLYLAGEWDSLLVTGKEALRMDIDYYYLRMRMGIAFYNQEDYRKAAVHFRKALSWNNGDPVALEYLYYSLLFSGREELASLVRKRFRGDLALRLPEEKGRFLEGISAEYLYSHRLDAALLSDPDALFSGLPPGSQYVPVRFSNATLSMVHDPGPGIAIHQSYTFLHKTNHLWYNDGLYRVNLGGQTVYQHQYYISPHLTTLSGLTIKPALHLLNVHYQVPVVGSPGYQGGTPTVNLLYDRYTDYLAGMGLVQAAGRWDLHMGFYYASLNLDRQAQGRLGLMWYPLGNLDLYGGAFLNGQVAYTTKENTTRFIPEVRFGFGIRKKVWIDFHAAAGDMKNYHEGNGSIVYNSFGEILDRIGTLSVSILLSEKGSLFYLGGRWSGGTSVFLPADPVTYPVNHQIRYNTISTYGGIIWKF